MSYKQGYISLGADTATDSSVYYSTTDLKSYSLAFKPLKKYVVSAVE
jgi:hypothetical protein